ncbi:hypothetical protein MRX96_000382 [Rhipicephalus microplus]
MRVRALTAEAFLSSVAVAGRPNAFSIQLAKWACCFGTRELQRARVLLGHADELGSFGVCFVAPSFHAIATVSTAAAFSLQPSSSPRRRLIRALSAETSTDWRSSVPGIIPEKATR